MNILVGLTGSVASVLYVKLLQSMKKLGTVEAILSVRAHHFVDTQSIDMVLRHTPPYQTRRTYWTDTDEWEWMRSDGELMRRSHHWVKNDPILHIDLRNRASALVIAPCSANTLAKLANGLTDNLLTSVARAWDFRTRPIIIAPAMNTFMWDHPVTKKHIETLMSWGYTVIPPQTKMLACKTEGNGAMADIDKIVNQLELQLQWDFPLKTDHCNGIPIGQHPGAFFTRRKFEHHTGVDLYTRDGEPVHAMESGTVVSIEHFTGAQDGSPWWEDTDCVLVEGPSGVICYGEISVAPHLRLGSAVTRRDHIGNVKRVLKKGKERPDIQGHSTSMLHIELYDHGQHKAGTPGDTSILRNPTMQLLSAFNAPTRLLKGNNEETTETAAVCGCGERSSRAGDHATERE